MRLRSVQIIASATARLIVVVMIASSSATYLHNDMANALAKVRTLQRNGRSFDLRNGAAH